MTPTVRALIDRAREAGVLGASSGTPAFEKLERTADLVIANATAAEPLVRADTQLMIHHAGDVILGLKLAMQATGAKRGVVALKRGDREAIESTRAAIDTDGFAKFHVDLHLVTPHYPAGDEAQLVSGLEDAPADIVTFNAMTLFHLAEAHRGQSVTGRLVTVTGAVRTPKTLWAPLGVPLSKLIEAAGGAAFEGPAGLLVGGPMRGRLCSPDETLTQGIATLAVLPADHPLIRRRSVPMRLDIRRAQSACHSCQRCTDLCPSYQAGSPLEPHRVMRALHMPFDAQAGVLADTLDCSGCNLCTHYACPVELSPGTLIAAIREEQLKAGNQGLRRVARLDRPRSQWKVPLGRLAKRLGLHGLDHVAPLDPQPLRVRRIELSLVQEGGKPLVPTVRLGDRVTYAQIVARPAPESVGVPLHTGLAGVVRSLGETIVIEE